MIIVLNLDSTLHDGIKHLVLNNDFHISMTSQQHLFNISEEVTYFNTASFSPAFKSLKRQGLMP